MFHPYGIMKISDAFVYRSEASSGADRRPKTQLIMFF
jgi:hypothetical protein